MVQSKEKKERGRKRGSAGACFCFDTRGGNRKFGQGGRCKKQKRGQGGWIKRIGWAGKLLGINLRVGTGQHMGRALVGIGLVEPSHQGGK